MDENKKRLLSFLLRNPCVDCGEEDPVVLEFDHVDPDNKRAAISAMIQNSYSWETIVSEIEKCVVRCANCHRRRTTSQFG